MSTLCGGCSKNWDPQKQWCTGASSRAWWRKRFQVNVWIFGGWLMRASFFRIITSPIDPASTTADGEKGKVMFWYQSAPQMWSCSIMFSIRIIKPGWWTHRHINQQDWHRISLDANRRMFGTGSASRESHILLVSSPGKWVAWCLLSQKEHILWLVADTNIPWHRKPWKFWGKYLDGPWNWSTV